MSKVTQNIQMSSCLQMYVYDRSLSIDVKKTLISN